MKHQIPKLNRPKFNELKSKGRELKCFFKREV